MKKDIYCLKKLGFLAPVFFIGLTYFPSISYGAPLFNCARHVVSKLGTSTNASKLASLTHQAKFKVRSNLLSYYSTSGRDAELGIKPLSSYSYFKSDTISANTNQISNHTETTISNRTQLTSNEPGANTEHYGRLNEESLMKIELTNFHNTGIPVILFDSNDNDLFLKIRSIMIYQLKAKEINIIDSCDQVFIDYDLNGSTVTLEWENFAGISISCKEHPETLNDLFQYFKSIESHLI